MKWFPFGKKREVTGNSHVIDVTDATFELQVIKRSYKQPVLVDFWAAWCGPCRQLGPVLERLAAQAENEWVLAKLDTEKNRRVAARFQIRSIPAVKLFRNGRVVGEFSGAIPEALAKRFITQSLAAPAQGLKGSTDAAQRLKQAQHHLKKGNGFEAFALLKDFPESEEAAGAERLFPLARFMCDMADGDGLTGLEALDGHYLASAKALQQRNPGQALASLLAALKTGEAIDAGYTRDVITSLFTLLGHNHPLTQEYQAKVGETAE